MLLFFSSSAKSCWEWIPFWCFDSKTNSLSP